MGMSGWCYILLRFRVWVVGYTDWKREGGGGVVFVYWGWSMGVMGMGVLGHIHYSSRNGKNEVDSSCYGHMGLESTHNSHHCRKKKRVISRFLERTDASARNGKLFYFALFLLIFLEPTPAFLVSPVSWS